MHVLFSEMQLCCCGETLTEFRTSSPPEMPEESCSRGTTELLSSGLVTHQKQHGAGIASRPLPPLLWLSALFGSPCWRWILLIFPRVFIQIASWTKGAGSCFFSPFRERQDCERKTTHQIRKEGGEEETPTRRIRFWGAFLGSKRSADKATKVASLYHKILFLNFEWKKVWDFWSLASIFYSILQSI